MSSFDDELGPASPKCSARRCRFPRESRCSSSSSGWANGISGSSPSRTRPASRGPASGWRVCAPGRRSRGRHVRVPFRAVAGSRRLLRREPDDRGRLDARTARPPPAHRRAVGRGQRRRLGGGGPDRAAGRSASDVSRRGRRNRWPRTRGRPLRVRPGHLQRARSRLPAHPRRGRGARRDRAPLGSRRAATSSRAASPSTAWSAGDSDSAPPSASGEGCANRALTWSDSPGRACFVRSSIAGDCERTSSWTAGFASATDSWRTVNRAAHVSSPQSRLKLTRRKILAFRRRVGSLDERLPMNARRRCGARHGPASRTACREPRCSRYTRAWPTSSPPRGSIRARPALGPSVQHLCRPEARLRALLARAGSPKAERAASGRAHGRAGSRPSRRQAR